MGTPSWGHVSKWMGRNREYGHTLSYTVHYETYSVLLWECFLSRSV